MKLKVNEIVKIIPNYGNGNMNRCCLLEDDEVVVFEIYNDEYGYTNVRASVCWTKKECEDAINKGAWTVIK